MVGKEKARATARGEEEAGGDKGEGVTGIGGNAGALVAAWVLGVGCGVGCCICIAAEVVRGPLDV